MTPGRIERRFAALAAEGRAGFVAYVMAGDPDFETALAIVRGLPAAGADLIELGMPFSDPMADGPVIQRAAIRALTAGATLDGVLDLVRRFRDQDTATPVVLMGYLNPLMSFGLVAFARAAAAAGADGAIVVDCPPEEAGPFADALDAENLALVRLATPTTDVARLAVICRRTRGFVYYVAVAGVTGAAEANAGAIAPAVARVRAASGLPVAAGFGIRTPARAAEVARVADAAVVGSALVEAIETAIAHNRDPAAIVLETAGALAEAVRSARRDPAR
ncbi:MAG: tryptophan synthase subunit alpha [Caulobacteraceae bacterium]